MRKAFFISRLKIYDSFTDPGSIAFVRGKWYSKEKGLLEVTA